MKVCVTGGCGFIGSHVVDAYVEAEFEVFVIDNLSTGKRENLNSAARLYEMDIRAGDIAAVFAAEKPEIVNHHAAQISVPLSVARPLYDAEVNIGGIIRLLELSREHRIGRFIFASTGGAIYGEASEVPTSEGYVPEPLSPYAIAKLASEKYIHFYYHQYGLPYTILRYANVYGPRQIPHGEAGVVAIFTEKLIAGVRPVLYHFPGEPEGMTRDYCFVKDVAEASMAATRGGREGIFNIGTGRGTTTRELYRGVVSALKEKGVSVAAGLEEPDRGEARPGDIRRNALNAHKAGRELGWKPARSLAEGLAETVAWYTGHGR